MLFRSLVTGGAGFLGSHLCDKLVAQGHHVLCVDNYFTGSKKNIEHLLDYKNFEVMRQDVCFPLYVEVDEIYNLYHILYASMFVTDYEVPENYNELINDFIEFLPDEEIISDKQIMINENKKSDIIASDIDFIELGFR